MCLEEGVYWRHSGWLRVGQALISLFVHLSSSSYTYMYNVVTFSDRALMMFHQWLHNKKNILGKDYFICEELSG